MSLEIKLMKISEVSEHLKLSKGNIYLKIKKGVFPKGVVVRIGKSYRFELNRLNNWVNENGDVIGGVVGVRGSK